MRRTFVVSSFLAPFVFAVLPLAALVMTAGGSPPTSTTVHLAPRALAPAPVTGRVAGTATFAQDSISECSGTLLGS